MTRRLIGPGAGDEVVVAELERALKRWRTRADRPGVTDLDALADLAMACEWVLQHEDVRSARSRVRRAGSAVGVVILLSAVVVVVAMLLLLMLRVAP